MNMYQSLKQEQANLIAEARAAFSKAEAEGRELSEAEAARDDEIHARLSAVKEQLGRMERMREAERTATAVTDHNMAAAQRASRNTVVEDVRDRIENDPTRGFRSMAEFATAVRHAYQPGSSQIDERLRYGAAPANFHYEVGSDEGAMVPPAFREDVWNAVDKYSSILPDLEPEPTTHNAVELNRDESTPWGSTGVQVRWRAEDAKMTASKLATDPSTMRLHELYAFVIATNDLLSDAPRLNDRLTSKAGQAIAYKLDEAVVNGSGVGQPLGWKEAACLVTVAKENAQTAATVVADNVAKMYARCLQPGNGIWYINQDVLPELWTITIGDRPMWYPPQATIQDSPEGGFLFGRPVRILESCQTLGTAGDIYFVNPRGYYAVQRQGMPDFAQSMHLYFDYNMQAFRWTFRFGGQPFLSAPVSPAKGSSTRSHFVALATRS